MAKRKKKVVKRKKATTGRTSAQAPNEANVPKKEKAPREERYKKIRHILSVLKREVDAAEEETTKGKQHEHINAAIVGSETLWQNLRALSREI